MANETVSPLGLDRYLCHQGNIFLRRTDDFKNLRSSISGPRSLGLLDNIPVRPRLLMGVKVLQVVLRYGR